MSIHDTTCNTLADRLVSTATITIQEADSVDDGPSSWIRPMVAAVQHHIFEELIAHEEAAGRHLTLQDAADFILQGVFA